MTSTGPLEGVRVLDLTRMFAGPFATMLLADLGADVVKLEEPRVGDPTRKNPPFIGDESTYFLSVNRGKRSLALDMKSPRGRETVLRLARVSDVVVENFRPGVLDRLGLGYDALRACREDIVLCSVSGFGQDGPLRAKTSFDLVNQAMAGVMSVTGEAGRPPVRIGLPAGDLAGGVFAVLGILAALRYRRLTGKGAWLDLSLHDCLISLLGYIAQEYLITGEVPTAVGSGHHHVVPYRAYQAADGYLVIAAFSQAFWEKLMQAVGRSDLVADLRFATLTDRKFHRAELDSILEDAFRQETVATWVGRLLAHDVPCGPVETVGAALSSDLAQEREMVVEMSHATLGKTKSLGSPFKVDGSSWLSRRGAPVLGCDTDQVLASVGYSAVEIDDLRFRGVAR